MGVFLVLAFANAGFANRVLQRPELVFNTETQIPKIAGVPPLIAQSSGECPVLYTKLSFQGERHGALGPYVPHHSGGSPSQSRTVLSGEIVYTYNPTTDAIDIANSVAVFAGTVNVAPWDPNTGPFPAEPVLTVEVPVSHQGGVAVGSNNPFGLTVKDATHAGDNNVFEFFSNEPQVIFFQPGPAGESQSNFQMTLSETDTPDQAEARAKVYKVANELSSEGQYTIRQTYATGSQSWVIRSVNVAFKFQARCSGVYEMVRKYDRRATGTQAWSSYKEERETRQVEQGDWNGSFAVPKESGFEIRLADITFEAKTGGCASDRCGVGGLAGLGSGPIPGSIDWNMPLGLGPDGRSVGILSLYSPQITPALYTPAALTGAVSGSDATIIRDGSGTIRQILAPQALVDVVVTSSDSYEVRVYDRAAAGTAGIDGLYTPSGSAYVTWRVDNPGGTGRWRMRRIIGSDVDVTLVDESQPGLRIFSEANGLRISEITQTTEGPDRVETIVVKDSAGTVSSKKKVYYRAFNLGEEKVKEVLDPDGAALTTLWGYSTAANRTYQKLTSIQYPDGYVEAMTYTDDTGVLSNHTVPFFHNGTKYIGSSRTLSDFNADGIVDRLWRDDSGWIFATGTGLLYTIDWGGVSNIGGIDYTLRESKVAVSPSAAWNTASNITTKERMYAGGPNDGRLAYRLNPDGTLFLARYASGANGTTITTEEQGAADPTGEAVVDGTRTVRVTAARGFEVSTTVTDIATALVVSSETVGQTDAFGRPTEIIHLDGAVETRGYCLSCGAVDHIELRGVTVNYEFDALKRKVLETRSAGTTVLAKTRFAYDADGRLLKTWRVNPADQTETLQASTVYGLAGRVATTTSLQSGTTGYSYAFGAENSTITTTAYADGGTRIESRGPSGTVFKVAGTAVAPVEYLGYNGGGLSSLMRTLHYYSPTEYVTEESAINYFGEVAYTTFPDGSRIFRYFDAIGRLVRTVDQDGIATLYGYDARGRQSVTALDLNGNGTIDYNGTDRISRTLDAVGTRDGHTVQRSTAQVWETDGADTPTNVSVSEQSADGLRSWQTVRGLTSSSVTAFTGSGGRTVTSTAPDGTQNIQTYLGDRLQSTVTSHPSLGSLGSVTYAYNDLGQLVSTTDARTGTTSYTYDANDRLHTVTTTDPDPNRSGDGYDPQTTSTAYDIMGRPTSVTQPDGGVASTTYYPTGAVKRTSGSRTYPVEYTYDIQNRVKTLTTWQDFSGNAGAAVTTWNYTNERGFLLNKRYADNTGPSYTYKPSGRLQTRTWARGASTYYSYNAAGDLTGVDYSDATPDVTIAYDRSGRPQTRTDAAGVCTWSYDASGQLKDEDYSGGPLAGLGVHRTFDPLLARLNSLSALSASSVLNQMTFGYDNASRLSVVTQGTNSAEYGYLANSPLVQSVTFKSGANPRLTTTKAYDNLNRLGSISNAPSVTSVQSVVYSYNSANQRTKATREDNARWDYTYDALGQVTSGKKSTAANVALPGHDFAWTYDDIGNRKTSTVGGVPSPRESVYTANLLNQYSARTVPGAFDLLAAAQPDATVTYQYPADTGTPLALPLYGDLRYAQLTADNSSANVATNVKVTGVKNNVGPAGEDAVTEITRGVFLPKTPEAFLYDADGNLTKDGKWTYAWDAENRLKVVEFYGDAPVSGGEGLAGTYYNSMDLSGTPVVQRNELIAFDWLNGSPAPEVNPDGFSARWTGYVEAPVSGSYSFQTISDDGVRVWVNDQLLIDHWTTHGPAVDTSSAITLQAGQRYPIKVEYFENFAGATMHLRWLKPGAADYVTVGALLPSLTAPSYASPLKKKLEFAYDGQGRRFSKKVYSWDGSAWTLASHTLFIYDGWNLLADLNALNSNAVVCTYVWGLDLSGSMQGAGGVGGLLFAQTVGGVPSPRVDAAAFDGNGNVIGLVDMATGAKSATYEYGAFGETLIADGPMHGAFPFRFSTKYTDTESGLLHYGLRYCNPSTGRWLSRDPIEEQGGLNLFGFIGNDALNSIDQIGLEPVITPAPSFDHLATPPAPPAPPLPGVAADGWKGALTPPAAGAKMKGAEALLKGLTGLLKNKLYENFVSKGIATCQAARRPNACSCCCVIEMYTVLYGPDKEDRVHRYVGAVLENSPCKKIKEDIRKFGQWRAARPEHSEDATLYLSM